VAVGSKKRVLAAGYVVTAWVVVESIGAHPDYIAKFNQFAGRHPERILAESDLDWGQDLHRLIARLKSLGVNEVGLEYFGTAPLSLVGLPAFHKPSATAPSTGYIAISVRILTLENASDGSYGWLKNYEPLERIGKSIYLFHIPPN
jgi:hypothetical protein